jgi:hypothetical protein
MMTNPNKIYHFTIPCVRYAQTTFHIRPKLPSIINFAVSFYCNFIHPFTPASTPLGLAFTGIILHPHIPQFIHQRVTALLLQLCLTESINRLQCLTIQLVVFLLELILLLFGTLD